MTGVDPDEPTMSARTAEAETQSVYAWGLADVEGDVPTQRLTPRRITTAAVAASLIVVASAAAVTLYAIRHTPQDAPTPTVALAAPTAPAPPHLDGTYKIVSDFDRATFRNNQREGGGSVAWGHDGNGDTTWAALLTTCTSMGCVATGKQLNEQLEELKPGTSLGLQLTNGTWQDMAPSRWQAECELSTGVVVESTNSFSWSFEPRPDGTFHGFTTITVETNECGDKGNTVLIPIVATRIGDVPAEFRA